MSADCLFIIRNIHRTDELKKLLVSFAKDRGIGVSFHPIDNLLIFNQIHIAVWDFVFSPADSFTCSNSVAELLNCYMDPSQSKTVEKIIAERTEVFQAITDICMHYTAELEIYISEDNPFLPDYSIYVVEANQVANTLFELFRQSIGVLPDICLLVN